MQQQRAAGMGQDGGAGRLAARLQALQRVAIATAHPGGADLFAHLVRELAESLGVAVALVAVFTDDTRSVMRTLAVRLDGQALRNFDYALAGSPCAQVQGQRFYYLAAGAEGQFAPGTMFAAKRMDSYAAFPMSDSAGTPLGLMVAMHRRPIADGDQAHAEAMLKIVAGRLAAEIERTRTDEALRAAALAVSAATSGTVFDELARLLATILHVELAFIARRDADDAKRLHILALCQDGRILRDIAYDVTGRPCETVYGERFRAYPAGLQQLFPADGHARALALESYAGHPLTALDGQPLGIVSVASRRPLAQLERVESLLKIFALRAAAEIERLREVTQTRLAVAELRARQEQYRAIFDGSVDPMVLWSSALRVVDVNDAFVRVTGLTREVVVGASASERPDAEDIARLLPLIEGALAGREGQAVERVSRADGSRFDIELRYLPVRFGGESYALGVGRDVSERLQRERALLHSEARLRATVEAAFDCIVGMDGAGRIVEFNAAAERTFGHRREDVLGRLLGEVMLPERHRAAHARGLQRFRGRSESPMVGRLVETQALHADGHEFPVEMAISPAAVPDGTIFVGHLRDITSRRQSEQALRDSEQQYRGIFNASADALVLRDAEFRIVDVNATYETMSGYARAEVLGVDRVLANPPEDGQTIRALHAQALRGEPIALETQLLRRDGRRYELELRGVPILHRGEPHVLYIGRDITQRRRADEALRDSEAQYRAIFSASADGMVLRDEQLVVVDANPAFTAMQGLTREQVVGRRHPPFAGSRHKAAGERMLRDALQGRPGTLLAESTDGRGRTIEIEVRALPLRYRDRPHVLSVVRDVTATRAAQRERERLEGQLRQAQKMEAIGQLTGGIAHDFNNILTSVIGYLVLGEERAQALGDATLERQLAQAQLAAQRARDLIAQMLAFARRQRGAPRVLELAALVRQTLGLLRPTLPSSIVIDSELGTGASPTVRADPVQLEQALFNLCINARDAMEGAGRIGVRLAAPGPGAWHCASCKACVEGGRWIELSVSDSGSGIAPDLLERVFDPFFSTKPPGRGSGMGLAMVHGIVHDHGGHVRVSTAPGEGSRFGVVLPLAEDGAPVAAMPAAAARAASAVALHGRVLLVEDDPLVGDYLVEQLAAWGLDVVLEREPLRALARLEDPSFALDLLITDHTMPQMTGLQLARQAAALRPALPVWLVSGNLDAVDDAALARAGVRATLAKPIAVERLRTLLVAGLGAAPLASPAE